MIMPPRCIQHTKMQLPPFLDYKNATTTFLDDGYTLCIRVVLFSLESVEQDMPRVHIIALGMDVIHGKPKFMNLGILPQKHFDP